MPMTLAEEGWILTLLVEEGKDAGDVGEQELSVHRFQGRGMGGERR